MKLFTKYNRINLAAMAIVFLISGTIYYILISSVLIHELDEALGEYEKRVEKYVGQNDSLPVFKNFEEVEVAYQPVKKKRSNGITSIERYDPEEKKMGTYRQLVFYQTLNDKIYEIKVAKPVEGTTLLTNVIAYSTLAMILLIILVSILLNRFILKRLWQPFYTTMKEMSRFKVAGETTPLLPDTAIEEFTLMNRSLLEVTTSARADYKTLKEFTENAAHEMQTPLAIIRSKLDLIIQEEGLSKDQGLAMKSAYSGVRRLSKLNQSLLLLAKIENKQFQETELINMKALLEEKVEQFAELRAGYAITVNTTLQPASVTASAELVDILLNNLFSNASRHNMKNGQIHILLDQHGMSISNTSKSGELNKTKLFNRFYKADQSSPHNGLGLAIVHQIADLSKLDLKYEYKDDFHIFSISW